MCECVMIRSLWWPGHFVVSTDIRCKLAPSLLSFALLSTLECDGPKGWVWLPIIISYLLPASVPPTKKFKKKKYVVRTDKKDATSLQIRQAMREIDLKIHYYMYGYYHPITLLINQHIRRERGARLLECNSFLFDGGGGFGKATSLVRSFGGIQPCQIHKKSPEEDNAS